MYLMNLLLVGAGDTDRKENDRKGKQKSFAQTNYFIRDNIIQLQSMNNEKKFEQTEKIVYFMDSKWVPNQLIYDYNRQFLCQNFLYLSDFNNHNF